MSQKVESCIICENYRFWLELQLVDDKGTKTTLTANVPLYAPSEAQAVRCKEQRPQGLIKAEGLTARPSIHEP
ncbi:hypothetical protein [Providencia sp. PROV278]|uniref:hypothetical protein n=1 Tax=Providencia sp. PROV278 TaxID=2936803 RepID=UPI00298FF44D|nr:hypothetical protein [Providencia sp. PROV278]